MKIKRIILGIIIFLVIIFLAFQSNLFISSEIKVAATNLFDGENKIKNVTKKTKDEYIKEKFSAVDEIYDVINKQGISIGNIYIVSPIGYNDEINILVGINRVGEKIAGIKVLSHKETPLYAGTLTEDWFLSRFKDKNIAMYLNLVKLDANTDQDIIQITGATISSQSVVNGVNSSIGTYNYLNSSKKMEKVAKNIPEYLIESDLESFSINNSEKGNIKVSVKELQNIPSMKSTCILRKTTGTEIEVTMEGPTLKSVLEYYDVDITKYNGVGATGRDGYYALISKEILDNRDIILAYKTNGKPLKEDEIPIRIAIPDEMGVYWVKMLNAIDLYEDIPEKNIRSIKIFDAFTRDIEPYMYEYYGSKDKSIEVGKILRKFDDINPKGFFTMVSSDGLEKNETINMVSQRYFIKVEGKNAPMNIAPNFKLGMNVKNIAYFNTTSDAVIFPEVIKNMSKETRIEDYVGLNLENVLDIVEIAEYNNIELVGFNDEKMTVSKDDVENCILTINDTKVTVISFKNNKTKQISDLLEIRILN